MTLDEVETFLAIIETGSITAAAGRLYVGQTTVSHRLRLLEEELGASLFVRQKGKRSIALTAEGESFVPIAHRWLALWRDTQNLHGQAFRRHICLGAVDLINNYTFVPLYQRLLREHPEICLDIRTQHSEEVPLLLSSHAIDIGFAFHPVSLPDILAKPLYSEKMYLLCSAESRYHAQMDASQLPAGEEVYLNWGSELEMWHNARWPGQNYLVKVNNGSLVGHYLTDSPTRWSIVPMSLVEALKPDPRIVSYPLRDPPPPRVCYQLTHRYPKPSMEDTISQILRAVEEFVARQPTLGPVP